MHNLDIIITYIDITDIDIIINLEIRLRYKDKGSFLGKNDIMKNMNRKGTKKMKKLQSFILREESKRIIC